MYLIFFDVDLDLIVTEVGSTCLEDATNGIVVLEATLEFWEGSWPILAANLNKGLAFLQELRSSKVWMDQNFVNLRMTETAVPNLLFSILLVWKTFFWGFSSLH